MKTLRALAVLALFIGNAANAEPIKLKFAFLGSDQSGLFVHVVKPFIEAVTAEGKGLVEFEVFPGGSLGRVPDQQVKLLVDGIVDVAFVVPGLTPERFKGSQVIEMPGLFRDVREATLTFTRLANAGALPGFEDFFVIAALATEPDSIHLKSAVPDLNGLKGRRVQVANAAVGEVVQRLGMVPVFLPINATAEAIASGKVEGSTVPVGGLLDFGIARITTTHYLLNMSSAPLSVLMNRAKFDAMPEAVQTILRKYSGEWTAERFIALREREAARAMEQLTGNPARKVLRPSKAELDVAKAAFDQVVGAWAAKSPANIALLKRVEAEVATIRPSQ